MSLRARGTFGLVGEVDGFGQNPRGLGRGMKTHRVFCPDEIKPPLCFSLKLWRELRLADALSFRDHNGIQHVGRGGAGPVEQGVRPYVCAGTPTKSANYVRRGHKL